MITITFTFPANNGRFLAGRPITVRGNVTWSDDDTVGVNGLPFASLVLTALESKLVEGPIGPVFTRFVHVGDVEIAPVELAGARSARWKHEVIPFDGMARYMLNVLALDADQQPVANSDPLLIHSVE
jgi:hypothetical protein